MLYILRAGSMTGILTRTHGTGPDTSTVHFRPRCKCVIKICVLGLETHQTVQEGTESNGYRGTRPGELVGSVNERSSHHRRVVSGQLHSGQCSNTGPTDRYHTCMSLDAFSDWTHHEMASGKRNESNAFSVLARAFCDDYACCLAWPVACSM